LGSASYQVVLLALSVLAMLGNVSCLIARCRLKESGPYAVFVTCLNLSDLLSGVYMGIVCAASQLYRGEYVLHQDAWKRSSVCKMAGFLHKSP
jgi:hypothetical protein